MSRAAIYARFSTDLQSERSIDDQVALCRAYALREGLDVVAVHSDAARSGASVFGRDGLAALLQAARARAFDVLLVEHTDRIARSMRDLSGIHEDLTFLGITIRAVHSGATMDTAMIGLFGLVGQMQREDGAKKVRRGMAGVVREGRHAGGRAYGYRPVEGRVGQLAAEPAEAATVLRIFEQYAAGRTPREIAYDLNRDGVAPPRGRAWNASTINGNGARGNGLLRNPVYVGEIVWNRVRMVKDPATGRRVSRANPQAEWQRADVPGLAIVDRELFDRVQARKEARSVGMPNRHRRQKHLLSGLLRCGACGAGMSTNGRDKSGRIRIRCSAAAESGTCPNPKTTYLALVEEAVVSGLTRELRAPEVLAEFVREYHEERRRLAGQAIADRSRLERRLAEVNREIERVVDGIAKGTGDPDILGPRTKVLGAERREIDAELAKVPEAPNLIALHPATLARYEEMVGRLQKALADGVAAGDTEAADAMRDLIDTVTVWPSPEWRGGVSIEVKGRLNALLGEEHYPNRVRMVWGEVVAEEGLEPPTRGL